MTKYRPGNVCGWMGAVLALICLGGPLGCAGHDDVKRVRTSAEIREFDFAVTSDGAIHLVWTSYSEDPDKSEGTARTLYQRTGPNGKRWLPAKVLGPAGGPPRILVVAGRLHVFLGRSLEHYISSDSGVTWTQAPPILRPDELARTFDIIVDDGGAIAVAYMSNDPMSSGSAVTPNVKVHIARVSSGAPESAVIDSSGDAARNQPGMKLVRADGALYLFYIFNPSWAGLRRVPPDETLPTYASRADLGGTWVAPRRIEVPNGSTKGKERASPIQVVGAGEEFIVLQNPMSFYRGQPGGAWEVVAGLKAYTFYNSEWTHDVAAAGVGSAGQLFWVDYRHERMPQKLYNPLTWILLDTPSYGNNDVMSVPIAPFMERGRNVSGLKPRRWTHDLARVVGVLTKEEGGQIYAVWAGVDGMLWPWQLTSTPMSFYIVKVPPQ